MGDHLEEKSLERRRFVRKLLTLGAAAGVAGILASDLPGKPAVEKVYAPSGSTMLVDGNNTGSSGTVLESDWTSVSGVGTLNIINHGTAGAGAFPTAIYAEVSNVDGVPVEGHNTATSGFGTGVYGLSPASLGQGVFGDSTDTSISGFASGVYGQSTSPGGQGVYGHAEVDTPLLYGVYGDTPSTTGSVGVGGIAYATSGANAGVYGETHAPQGAGTQGNAYANGGVGILGRSLSAGARPIIAVGNPSVSGGQTANLQEWWNSPVSLSPLSVVDPNGNFGIGTSTPGFSLDVLSSGRATVRATGGGGAGGEFRADTSAAGSQASFSFYDQGAPKYQFGKNTDNTFFIWDQVNTHEIMYVNPSSKVISFDPNALPYNVGIGTNSPAYKLDVAGQVHATGFPTSSDMRFKEDIQPIDNALDKVLRLNGVYFKWNHLHRETLKRSNTLTSRQVGLIAQQVKEVVPEIVSEWADQGADDYLAVDYSRLAAITIEAMKELATKNSEQQSTIEVMKEQQDQFKNENEKLLERIAILERTVKQFPAS